jgi:hypothetical protein
MIPIVIHPCATIWQVLQLCKRQGFRARVTWIGKRMVVELTK